MSQSEPELITISDGGGADPAQNTTLAAVLKRIKSQGVPKDNIENALKKVRLSCVQCLRSQSGFSLRQLEVRIRETSK